MAVKKCIHCFYFNFDLFSFGMDSNGTKKICVGENEPFVSVWPSTQFFPAQILRLLTVMNFRFGNEIDDGDGWCRWWRWLLLDWHDRTMRHTDIALTSTFSIHQPFNK